jgi:hypothetical protein
MSDQVPFDIKLKVMYNDDDDDRDIAEITQRLSRDIDRLDVENVQPVKDENVPENTKTGGAEITGELLITLLGSSGIAVGLVGLVKSWMIREGHKIKFTRTHSNGTVDEIEVTGSNTDQENRLIDMFTKK